MAAFQGGAFEYPPKPFDIDHALALSSAARPPRPSVPSASAAVAETPEILGAGARDAGGVRAIGRLSQSNTTVMITGESGTGKELVARALHRHSPRAAMPFVAINTAAIPKDLLESELFGHERALVHRRAGDAPRPLRAGRGCTLFLDEIGDMPAGTWQVRLLRVLADGEYYRVGGHAPLRANVRIIAATHQEPGGARAGASSARTHASPQRRAPAAACCARASRTRWRGISLQKSARDLAVEPKALSEDAQKVLTQFARGNAPARERLPLAHGDGAGPADRGGGPAAGTARAPTAARRRDVDWRTRRPRVSSLALARGERNVGDRLEQEFEKTLIRRALTHTGGHRMEAAAWLGGAIRSRARSRSRLEPERARAASGGPASRNRVWTPRRRVQVALDQLR